VEPAKLNLPKPNYNKPKGFRATITNLDVGVSWQDLKDFARTANGEVLYSNVYKEGDRKVGVVEYDSREACEDAVRQLDGSKFNDNVVSMTMVINQCLQIIEL
jgi:arginine/serine-rich splicing factor 4/5/6